MAEAFEHRDFGTEALRRTTGEHLATGVLVGGGDHDESGPSLGVLQLAAPFGHRRLGGRTVQRQDAPTHLGSGGHRARPRRVGRHAGVDEAGDAVVESASSSSPRRTPRRRRVSARPGRGRARRTRDRRSRRCRSSTNGSDRAASPRRAAHGRRPSRGRSGRSDRRCSRARRPARRGSRRTSRRTRRVPAHRTPAATARRRRRGRARPAADPRSRPVSGLPWTSTTVMTTSSKRRCRSGPGIGSGSHSGRDCQDVVERTLARQHIHREGEASLDLAEPARRTARRLESRRATPRRSCAAGPSSISRPSAAASISAMRARSRSRVAACHGSISATVASSNALASSTGESM